MLEKDCKKVDSNRGPFRADHFSELLHQSLIKPRKVDYVQQIHIDDQYWRFYDPDETDENNMNLESCQPHRYTDLEMGAFDKLVKNTDLVRFEEKERRISKIKADDQNPILALLLSQLHLLAHLVI